MRDRSAGRAWRPFPLAGPAVVERSPGPSAEHRADRDVRARRYRSGFVAAVRGPWQRRGDVRAARRADRPPSPSPERPPVVSLASHFQVVRDPRRPPARTETGAAGRAPPRGAPSRPGAFETDGGFGEGYGGNRAERLLSCSVVGCGRADLPHPVAGLCDRQRLAARKGPYAGLECGRRSRTASRPSVERGRARPPRRAADLATNCVAASPSIPSIRLRPLRQAAR